LKLYLFTPIPEKYRGEFYKQMRQQNVRIIHVLAITMVLLVTVTYASEVFFDYSTLLKNYTAYRNVTAYFLITALPLAILFTWLRQKRSHEALHKFNWLAFLYAGLFIGGNIWLSFLSQANPKNAITMLMMSMLLIGAMMVLTLAETLLLIFPCIAVFTIGLAYFQTDPALWLANYFVFCFVITAFFVVSRMIYSYHVNYYTKVRTIEENTLEIRLANEAKNEILSVVAHDLRSPISNIQTLVELIQNYELSAVEKNEYLRRIVDCCIKANTTIRDIINTARQDTMAEMTVSRENLNTVIWDMYSGWEKIINGKRKLNLVLPAQEVFADINKDKFHRIMDNLISNAIKFTTELNGSISIELRINDNKACIAVKDNGIGIPEHQLPHLFEKFTAAGRTGLNNEASIGLGLSISKQLVEKHKGRIYVETEEYKGTTFYIELPLKTNIITV
jgi:two-component system sensor histidine kinase VicK